MNNIFEKMNIPQLGDNDFQNKFDEFCKAIKQNIERLVSVQYTKGESGSSVYTTKIHVGYDESSNTLTSISAGILNAIFNTNIFNTLSGPDYVNTEIGGDNIDIMVNNECFKEGGLAPSIVVDDIEYKAIPTLMGNTEGFDVEINIDDETGKAYLSSPYIFMDGRIEGLKNISSVEPDIYRIFHDFSIAVYGEGTKPENSESDNPTDWDWHFELVSIVPKLYYDDNIKEFCWDVNGQQTGITAQGIKGDNGISSKTIIAIGERNNDIINLNKIQHVDEQGTIHWAEWDGDSFGEDPDIQPTTNDIVLVFTDPQGPEEPYAYAYLGKLYKGENYWFTYIGSDDGGRCDIFASIRERDFWRLMMSINEYTTGSPRGYVLPANPSRNSNQTVNPPQENHMIYSEEGSADSHGYSRLHVAPVKIEDTYQPGNNPNPSDHTGDMQVDYNVGVQGSVGIGENLDVQGDTNLQNVSIQGLMNVQGNLNVQGNIETTGITVTGGLWPTVIDKPNPKLACLSRFYDTSYKVMRSAYSVGVQLKIKYNISISSKLEITIGQLSKTDDSTANVLHNIMQGYQDNWRKSDWNPDETQTLAYDDAFNKSDSPKHSKLYEAVRYTIPINITKSIDDINIAAIRDENALMGDITNPQDYNTISYRGYVQGLQGSSNYDDVDRKICEGSTLGAATRSAEYSNSDQYKINGKLYYAPIDKEINYNLDFFVRIFETIQTKSHDQGNASNPVIQITVTPIGCLYSDDYMAAIWNGVNVDNIIPISISKMNNSGFTAVGISNYGHSSDDREELCKLNPLISDTFIGDNPQLEYQPIPGYIKKNTEIIASGGEVKSSYLISMFDTYAPILGPSGETILTQCFDCQPLGARYFDIAPGVRIVNHNIKVCPNNIKNGVLKQNNGNIGWEMLEPIPMATIPCNGYIGSSSISSQRLSKVGMSEQISQNEISGCRGILFHGLLVYPYTPCVINYNGNINSIPDLYNDAYVGGEHYINNARMMGVTDGYVDGINYSTVINPIDPIEPIIPEDSASPDIGDDSVAPTDPI